MGKLTFTRSYASIIPAEELASYTNRVFDLEQLKSELAHRESVYLLVLASMIPCGYSKLEPTAPPLEINGPTCRGLPARDSRAGRPRHSAAKMAATHPNPVELVRLYVLPEWTGAGIGSKLIEASLDTAFEQGYRSCWLRVWEGNTRAIEFYRHRGFSEVGSEPYHVGRCAETVLLLIRDLSRRNPHRQA
jgi:ribosomal protein S18 acetylase RimI-like enzyme